MARGTLQREASTTGPTSAGAAAGRQAAARERARGRFLDLAERLVTLGSPLILVAVWELVARLELIDVRFFPRPSRVLEQLMLMVESGELARHVGATLMRLGIGFAAGGLAGVALGLLMGLSRWIRAAMNPIAMSVYPIPKVAIFPLVLLIFGLGETSKIFTIAIATFFQVLFPTIGGVLGIPRIYLQAGKNYGARGLDFYRTIAFPGALPSIFVGLRIALGVGLLVTVAVEFVGADTGIGYLIWNSWQIFNVNRMFVGLLSAAVLGYISSVVLDELQKRLVPWRY